MKIFLIGLGLINIILSILKPPFFWSSRKALRVRSFLGDTITMILYIGIGIFLVYIGLTEY